MSDTYKIKVTYTVEMEIPAEYYPLPCRGVCIAPCVRG